MKKRAWKSVAALALAAALLSIDAGALFGWRSEERKDDGTEVDNIVCTTYQGVPCQGRFSGSGEREAAVFSLVKEPRKGSVTVENDRFIYTPARNASGTDRFTYVAVDAAGNASLPAAVEIDIQKVRSGVSYADMTQSDAAVAAQHLAEEGIFIGAKLGDHYYFEPDREVLRSEFLAMALETMEREVTDVTMTGFCDDALIPVWAKAYAAAGVAEGVIEGTATEVGHAFRGDEVITFNEAATVLNRVLGLENVDLQVWYADREATPSWAAQAVANMESVQVLAAGSFGSLDLENAVCRDDMAKMLSAVRVLLEGSR